MIVTSQAVLTEIVRACDERHIAALVLLAEALGVERKAVVMAVQRLKRRGFVRQWRKGDPGFYVATDAGRAFLAEGRQIQGGQDSPRPRIRTRGLRQRAWWVIRARGVVSLPDLLATLCDGTERAAHSNLHRYLRVLLRAGYLAELPQRQPGTRVQSNGHKRFRLVRDTGRQAPVLRQRQGVVYDPNTGEHIALEPGEAS